jgi:ubiquitin-protein ligase
MQFYPGVTYHANQQGIDQYRCPLTLSVSKTPLFIRIDLPPTFPVQRPNLVVLARVLHDTIDPRTKVIANKQLDTWDIYQRGSNLLSVVREIHALFDRTPPLPEKIA